MTKAWNGGSVEAAMEYARQMRDRAIAQGATLCDECGGEGGTLGGLCVQCQGAGCIVPPEGLSPPNALGCACVGLDAHDCWAMRYGVPREDTQAIQDNGGPCECACHDEDDFDRCPTCKGRGLVNPLTAPPDFFCVGTTDCPHCDGTGRI